MAQRSLSEDQVRLLLMSQDMANKVVRSFIALAMLTGDEAVKECGRQTLRTLTLQDMFLSNLKKQIDE